VQSTGSRLHAFKNLSALDIDGLLNPENSKNSGAARPHNSILSGKTQGNFMTSPV
jgi:hypothetical protein